MFSTRAQEGPATFIIFYVEDEGAFATNGAGDISGSNSFSQWAPIS